MMAFTKERQRITYEWRGQLTTDDLQVVSDRSGLKKLVCIDVRPDDDNTFLYRDGPFELQFDATHVWQGLREPRWDVGLGYALNKLPSALRVTLDDAKVRDIMKSLKSAFLVFTPTADGPVKKIRFDMRGWDGSSFFRNNLIDGDQL